MFVQPLFSKKEQIQLEKYCSKKNPFRLERVLSYNP